MWETILPIAANLISGSMGASAARSSGDAQAASTDRATEEQRRQFDKQVELQSPFRDAGVTGLNRLMYLLGLGGGGGTTSAPSQSREQLRQQLLPQFTNTTEKTVYDTMLGMLPGYVSGPQIEKQTTIDENGLSSAIERALAQQTGQTGQSGQSGALSDADYGSLMRDFSMADYQADPGYAFRKAEGMKGIESGAAARGGLLSGAALKAIQKYGQDLASNEYGNAYNRFTANQTNKYNKLSGLVNTGQGATNVLSNAAANLGNSVSNNIMSGAAAKAAGDVGSANAWTNAIGQGIGAWQQNQLMDMIRNPKTSSYVPGYGYGTSYGE